MFDWKNVVERALWTAAQAFLAVFVVTDASTIKVGIAAAAAAALSVIKTAVQEKVTA